jgi:TM2 domain-containing membrane protein YozV
MGLGQFMLGQHAKGATILVVSYLMAAVSGGFAVPILWIVVGMDAACPLASTIWPCVRSINE